MVSKANTGVRRHGLRATVLNTICFSKGRGKRLPRLGLQKGSLGRGSKMVQGEKS